MSQTFNLFIILDLDPKSRWNQTEFDRRLQEKRRDWSRLSQFPNKKGIQAKKNLGLISEINKVASDDSERGKHAAEAKKLQGKDQKEKSNELTERLKLLQTKGYILEAEFMELVKAYGTIFSERKIRQRIKVPIKKEVESKAGPNQPVLDSSIMKEIQKRLDSLNHQTLYDFLGIGQADNHLLHKQAQTLYDNVNRKGSKTADDDLISVLAGHGLVIFKNGTERAKYDEALKLQAYEVITQKANMVADVSKEITAQQMKQLLDEARKRRLDPKQAESIIREHARKRGFAVVIAQGAADTAKSQQLCGYCETLNPSAEKYCTQCGNLLADKCPNCSKTVKSDARACGSCGFQVGNRSVIKLWLGEARQAVQDRDYEEAQQRVAQAAKGWPATGKDALLQDIQALSKKIEPLYKKQEKTKQQLDTAIREKRFYAARKVADQLADLSPARDPSIISYKAQIGKKINAVEAKLKRAKATKRKPEELVDLYSDVLQLCHDCEPAREMLAKTPPSPPKNLRVTKGGNLVQLTWQGSSAKNIRYQVVRKAHTRPVSAHDGIVLATVSDTVYDDQTPEIGVPLFYAIYADRQSVVSAIGAALPHPVLMTQEVRYLTAESEDGQILLSWIPPENSCEIVVARSANNYPESVSSGHPLRPLDEKRAVDQGLKNGQTYYYTVFCRFKSHTGKLVTTAGQQIKATPAEPPEPIAKLEITSKQDQQTHQLTIRYPKPAKGDVVVLRSQKELTIHLGAKLPYSKLRHYGHVLTANNHMVKDQIKELGFYYYTPVVVFQETAYIGRSHKYTCVDDVTNLTIQNLGHVLHLQWDWPNNCHEAIVTYSTTSWPAANSSQGSQVSLTRAEYDLKGFFEIRDPPPEDHYMIVFAVINQEEDKIIAPGTSDGARKQIRLFSRITLTYEIRKPWFKKERQLYLEIIGEGELPALCLVSKQRTLPMRRHDGQVVIDIPTRPIEQKSVTIPIDGSMLSPQKFGKLFVKDDSLVDSVIIRHPSLEKLKLF